MSEHAGFLVVTVSQRDIELLLTCVIDPFLRLRFHAASEGAELYDDGERIVAVTEQEADTVIGVLRQMIMQDGLTGDGELTENGSRAERIIDLLQTAILERRESEASDSFDILPDIRSAL